MESITIYSTLDRATNFPISSGKQVLIQELIANGTSLLVVTSIMCCKKYLSSVTEATEETFWCMTQIVCIS